MATLPTTHEFLCFGDRAALAACPTAAPRVHLVEVPLTAPAAVAASAAGHRSIMDMLRLTRAVYRGRLDVFFSPSIYTYFPLPPGLPAVVTIHDAIAERFPHLTLPSPQARLFWRLKTRLALWQARLVLTVSDYAAREVAAVHQVPPHKMRVAVEAPTAEYQPAPPEQVERARVRAGVPPGVQWFTYVGGFSPHKRLDVILRAHATLCREEGLPVHLVLIGRRQGDVFLSTGESLEALVHELGTTEQVHWTGYLEDEEVAALHTGAIATLLVSESEGFGLPAVEGAACGTPVIATTASPLPELLSGGGLFVPPGDVDALTQALRTLACDTGSRLAMGMVARSRAAALTWQATARAALGAIEEAAG